MWGAIVGARSLATSMHTKRRKLMPTLYLTEDYALVRRDGEDSLLVQVPERRAKDGAAPAPARKERIPLIKVDEVVGLGEVTLSASALHLLLERNIEITFLGHYGQFKGQLSPSFSKNAILRMAQYRAHQEMTRRCELARRFVIGKLTNQRTMLQRYHRRQSDAEMGQTIEHMAHLLRQLAALPLEQTHAAQRLASGDNRIAGTPLEAILGLEGAGSAAYFGRFGRLLSDPRQCLAQFWLRVANQQGRQRGPIGGLRPFCGLLAQCFLWSSCLSSRFDGRIPADHRVFSGLDDAQQTDAHAR